MKVIREGDVHKVITIDGVDFEIRYGYESPRDKERGWDPEPIYPDFEKEPQYNPEGRPFVTVYHSICEHYQPKEKVSGENWCHDCKLFDRRDIYIGICTCEKRKMMAVARSGTPPDEGERGDEIACK